MASTSLQPHGLQPKVVFIKRKSNQGFGFTLRHFIAYPPETWDSSNMYHGKAMETIFIKEVHMNSPAYLAGLQTGDRILTVNDEPIAGVPYSVIVSRIKQTPILLKLEVVSKECDVLQMYYTDIAHNPESNRSREANKFALLNYVSSRKTLSFPTTAPVHMAKFSNSCHSETRKNLKLNEKFSVGSTNFNFPTISDTGTNNSCDFMARIRKSIEQKEEFLKAVSPQSYPNSVFKTFKSSDNLKRISSDKMNLYALNSLGISDNPKGEDDDKEFRDITDVYYDEHNLYGRKDGKISKAIERYNPVSPITLKVSPNEPSLSLVRVPLAFDKTLHSKEKRNEKKVDVKLNNSMQSRSNMKVGTFAEQSDMERYKDNDSDCIKSDCASGFSKSSQVSRRYKPVSVHDDNKLMRRISYLRATNNEDSFQYPEVSTELMNFDEKLECYDKEIECEKLNDIPSTPITSELSEPIVTDMEIKSSSIFEKRLTEYRSWKHVKIELKGDVLKIFTGRNTKSDANIIELKLRNYELSEDFSGRRKYVFKLQSVAQKAEELTASGGSSNSASNKTQFNDILFKTENSSEMKKWLELLKSRTRDSSHENEQGKQLAEPQKTAAVSSMSTAEYPEDNNEFKRAAGVLSCTETKDIETESNVCSPVIKARKPEKSDKDLGSPKSKNWRGILFRKIHGTQVAEGAGNQMCSGSRPAGSIGYPLKSCPMSKDNEYVPFIVDICTKIVESKGLHVVGIYRIPGNKAAISELKDQVNRTDFVWDKVNEDVRWDDVNVVSSLLKLFIRSLPDALLPSTFYNHFIEADKNTGEQRLKEIKQLLESLPVYSYETLKHIIRHLHRISENCDVNLMEPKNLAIIFGPSIIRTPNETLEIAVKDMKHQCRIVELLVSQYEYFFENGAFPQLEDNLSSMVTSVTQQDQTNLLLGNVQKIERKYSDKESMASRFIPHLRRRSQSKRSTINSDTYSGESILSLECKKLVNDQDQGESSEHGSKEERGSLEISFSLTDEESSNSRLSDSGSMSLTTITDTLDSKLRNLRSTSESQSDENDSPNKQQQQPLLQQKPTLSRRNIIIQPLVLHENIPFADESPERPNSSILDNMAHIKNNSMFSRTTNTSLTNSNNSSCSSKNNNKNNNNNNNNNTINTSRDAFKSHLNGSKISSSVHHGSCSDDSEVSTTSDPKESLLISPSFLERYKKRKGGSSGYKLFRSASFNCRNYSAKFGNNTASNLTKDEKTDMNITKKRQIQNKQNRSIKRRHTVGGPSDYSATITRRTDNDHVLEVGIRIKNLNRRS